MKKRSWLAAALLALPALGSAAPPVQDGAKPVLLCGGFRFAEGPADDGRGNVYFTDVPAGVIHIWTAAGELKTHRDHAGGANGLAFDRDGSLVICEGAARRLTRDNLHGTVSVLAAAFDGKKLNSPNDLWIDAKGGIYFTDPRYGRVDDLEQDRMAVYYLPKNGALQRVAGDLVKPNGIVGTPDGRRLYVAAEGAGKIWAYPVLKTGRLGQPRLFADSGAAGLALDAAGNLYAAAGQVRVYAPNGKLLEEIKFPERPVNLCFGGAGGQTLFVTTRTALYSLQMTGGGAK
jgi:gluconolactonase